SSLRIRKSWVIFLSLLYLALPNIIMMMAWVKPISACLIIIGIIASLLYYAVTQLKSEAGRFIPLTQKNAWLLLLTVLLVSMPFIHDGLVGLFTTGYDYHVSRQAYYSNLVDAPWPVIYPDGSTVTYYIGMFLPPALICRLLSISPGYGCIAAQYVMLAWIVLGLTLSLLLIFTQRRRISILFVFFFVFLGDPILMMWGTQAGNAAIQWVADSLTSFTGLDCGIMNWHTSRFALFSLAQSAGCYTSNIPLLLTISILLNVRRERNFVIPLTISMIFLLSPFGVLGCLPFALMTYDFSGILKKGGALRSTVYMLLPLAMAVVAYTYYSRTDVFFSTSDGRTTIVSTVYAIHGFKGVLFVFMGVIIPALLMFFPLRRTIRFSRIAIIAMVCIIVVSQIWMGGVICRLNELWLKTSPMYTFVLLIYLAYTWKRLGADKYIPITVSAVMCVCFAFSCFLVYTGQSYVEDDCNGHLYHVHRDSINVKKDLVEGLLYTESGESEKNFPGCILPRAHGCDYTRPLLRPVKEFILKETK
ncbi:MAG: hypothetical protein MR890_02015, partial [Akkermansia muciniphila]|nr:hypothetical protein [Akkermansia muciniphila]